MAESAAWGSVPQEDTVGTADAFPRIDVLLANAVCRGRPVQYALDRDATPLSREEVAAWLTGAEGEGFTRVRYVVDPHGAGAVRVSLCVAQPTAPETPA